jgi:uncharacterized RDD family membrane protein YckC
MTATTQPQTGVPANLGWRLLAAVYDVLPLLALWFLAAVLALALTGGALDVHRLADKVLVQALILVFTAAYFAVSWSRGGQTVGMKPWHLRVVRGDGTPLDLPRALLRFAVAMFSLAPAGLGFWWALFDAQHRTWHDIAAGTLVVRIEVARAASRSA